MATWAKGIDFKNTKNTARIGGVGIYGTDTASEKIYIGFGAEPWNNSGLQVTKSGINYKGNKIYHAGDKPTLSDLGAAASSHTHSYLPLTGGSLTGNIAFTKDNTGMNFYDGAKIYKKSGSGLTIVPHHDSIGLTVTNASETGNIFNVCSNSITYKGNKIYHAGDKPTASEIGAAAASHTHNYAPVENGVQRWNSVIKCATWSRIMYLSGHTIVGHSGIINIQGTRTNVVFNATFIINTSHSSKAYITQINNTNYSNFQIRAVTNGNGETYVEVYDNANSATNATTQTLNISYTAISGIGAGTLTKYTAFTDGTTIPTGFAEVHKITTVNGSHYSGNAATATKLQTARTINGTSFNGSANITTANWGTARTITIGNTGKSVNGSGNVSWSLSEIGAAASSHTHNYLPLSGGTISGETVFNNYLSLNAWSGYGTGKAQIWYNGNNKQLIVQPNAVTDIIVNNNKVYHAGNKPTASEIGAAASNHTHSNYATGALTNSYNNGTGEPCEGYIHLGGSKYLMYGYCSISLTANVGGERTYSVPGCKRIYGITLSCYTKGGTGNFGELALKQTYSDGFTFRLWNVNSGGAHYITYMIIGDR